MIPYAHQTIEDDDIAAVVNVLRSDWLTQGPTVERFEEAVAEFVGAKYAVAVNSGTAALHCAYAAASDMFDVRYVNIPEITFVATANAAGYVGLDVKLFDIDQRGMIQWPAYYDVNPQTLVVPVHMAGAAATIPETGAVVMIEDACHALGGYDNEGKRIGSCARSLAACFSLHGSKPVPAGEGGLITTNNEDVAAFCRSFRDHGRENARMYRLGFNYRMPEMTAALGLTQLAKCDRLRDMRATIAKVYNERLPYWVLRPEWQERGTWHLYCARVPAEKRDPLLWHLKANGIDAQVHYPRVSSHPYWSHLRDDTPGAKDWASREISLPLYAGLTVEEVERVCSTIERFQ